MVGQILMIFSADPMKFQFPMCEIYRLSEGYKWAIDKIWGPRAKNRFSGEIRFFRPKKTHFLF